MPESSAHADSFARDHLPPPERLPLLDLSGTPETAAYPRRMNCATELIDRQAERFGARPAYHFGDQTWSYAELLAVAHVRRFRPSDSRERWTKGVGVLGPSSVRGTMSSDFPVEGVELTLLLVVEDIARSRAFYTGVLGATLFREYGGLLITCDPGAGETRRLSAPRHRR